MQIEFTEGDLEKVAELVATRLEDKVMARLMGSAGWETMHKRAEHFAQMYMGQSNYNGEAVDAMRKALTADGNKMLLSIVSEAVRQVGKDDPDLIRMVRQEIYRQAVESAERAARLLNEGD